MTEEDGRPKASGPPREEGKPTCRTRQQTNSGHARPSPLVEYPMTAASTAAPSSEHVPWTSHRARLASLTRSRTPDDPDLLAARRDLRAARLAEHVAKEVEAFPPLTEEQRARVAALLT